MSAARWIAKQSLTKILSWPDAAWPPVVKWELVFPAWHLLKTLSFYASECNYSSVPIRSLRSSSCCWWPMLREPVSQADGWQLFGDLWCPLPSGQPDTTTFKLCSFFIWMSVLSNLGNRTPAISTANKCLIHWTIASWAPQALIFKIQSE